MRTKIPNAWDPQDPVEQERERYDREIRVVDFLAFAVIPFATLPFAGLPLNEIATLAIVGLASFREPRPALGRPGWFAGLMLVILTILTLSMLLNQIDASRRVVHMVGWAGLALCLSSGRISARSASLGLGVGLLSATVLSLVGVGGGGYAGRLTGMWGDPNAAAMYLTVLGCLVVAHSPRPWLRWLILALLVTTTVLTFSRTGLLTMAAIALWVLLGRRLAALGGALLVIALTWVVGNIPQSLVTFGPFAKRTGSDLLRDRIIAEERKLLDAAPWYGNGPGTSQVSIEDNLFFFHSSYLSTRNEGGWVLLLAILALLALTFLTLSGASRRRARPEAWLQASIIAVVVMSVTLGEVLMELPAAIALGFVMEQHLRNKRMSRPDALTAPWEAAPSMQLASRPSVREGPA